MELQCKKAACRGWKQSRDLETTKQGFRSMFQGYRHWVRKAKAQLEFRPVKDIKGNKKSFCCYVSSQRLNKENGSFLLNNTGE